ncbi:uncharacterized protein JN550_013360 [Neoarthrinium moseri]|uniref:uncharacterized protein n=1 Tax=Neoarthrinium moseri TaxID=1658444 RepID=UPI001FDC528C|nr:uncharacterized protein JN550_013360 [Neoarthrinium moseri]KAI1857277.1 hypothetical protein JN550_013360 [Neoarthrinium moseri]
MIQSVVPLLDHIVVLIPHSFLASPPQWFVDLFTYFPGGQHADRLTENTLVLLPDGSYIEFIAFVPGIDPEKREGHKWGKAREGTVIDWALTLPGSAGDGLGEQTRAFVKIQEAVRETGTGIIYGDLVAGGRHRPDGQQLKWAVAGAYRDRDGRLEAVDPGQLPFWCLDDTKRELRVPYIKPGVSQHPTGAVGVALVSVTPDDQAEAERLDKAYGAILGGDEAESDSIWDLKTLAGEALHAGGQVRLGAAADKARLSISLFTGSGAFVGKKVGGKVTDDVSLEFEFIAAK